MFNDEMDLKHEEEKDKLRAEIQQLKLQIEELKKKAAQDGVDYCEVIAQRQKVQKDLEAANRLNAELMEKLERAIKWLRRLEKDYPGCLNDDAIEKHLSLKRFDAGGPKCTCASNGSHAVFCPKYLPPSGVDH